MLGGNCSLGQEFAEVHAGARMDRLCAKSYASDEDPATGDASQGWEEEQFTRWIHAMHCKGSRTELCSFLRHC